jgi:hypothetical protein
MSGYIPKNSLKACPEAKNKTLAKQKAFDIPSFHGSIKRDYEANLISLKDAALEFYRGNHTFHVDLEYTKRQLGI